MTTFDSRQKSFEDKFARDADLQFKVMARRNRLFGMWAAERLGKSAEDAAEYAKTVVAADFEEAGDEDVYRKVAADLGDAATESEIRAAMHTTFVEAQRQYMDVA